MGYKNCGKQSWFIFMLIFRFVVFLLRNWVSIGFRTPSLAHLASTFLTLATAYFPSIFSPRQTSCPITNTIQLAWRVRVSSSKLFPFHVVTLQLCNRGNTRQFFFYFWIYKLVVFCHPLAHGCITMQEFSPIFVEIQESKQVWIIATLFCRFCLSFRCYEEIWIF